ncbi:hypothetical protein MP228_010330 [Amoeboaphelidium protococcarum]|nr:hypothetical protein MP228_010330 [Amoeboaphelidium protococcarum]
MAKRNQNVDVLARALVGERESYQGAVRSDFQLHMSSVNDPSFKKLQRMLTMWVNNTTKGGSTSVIDLVSDLADGQILANFLSLLTGKPLELPPAISDRARRQNFQLIVSFIQRELSLSENDQWSLQGLFERDISSTYCLLVDLAHALQCPYQLPSNVSIAIVHTESINGIKTNKTRKVQLTKDEKLFYRPDMIGSNQNLKGSVLSLTEDPFDALFDSNHEKELEQIKHLVTEFLKTHLAKVDRQITDLAQDMHDGTNFVLLIAVLSNFFVPLNKFSISPQTNEDKLKNVLFLLKMLERLGIPGSKWNAADVVRKDLKMILRLSFDIFKSFNAN